MSVGMRAEHSGRADGSGKDPRREGALGAAAQQPRKLRAAKARGVTDVTGFGLLGHAVEVATESHVQLRLQFDRLPYHAGAKEYAQEWLFPAGACRNQGGQGGGASAG